MPKTPTEDRRVEKTRKLLRESLASLVREKSYDRIAVKEILDRANVGRSTFYTHFRDKDELLASVILEMLSSASGHRRRSSGRGSERILWFSLPIFEYLEGHRRHAGESAMKHGGRLLHKHLQKLLAGLILEDVRDLDRRRKKTGPVPPAVLARYVASTFVLVLNWWVESGTRLPSRDADAIFRALVVPTLTAT